MVYTFKHLRDQVIRLLDDDSATTVAIVKDLMNSAHAQRCGEFPWPFMLSEATTLTTVPGQRVYTLPYEFANPLYFYNKTSKWYLKEVSDRNMGPDGHEWIEKTGPARNFTFWGHSPLKTQPSSPSTITVVSSSSSDTGGTYQVVIKGEKADGEVVAEVLSLTGATPVTGSIQYARVHALTKSGAFNGTLTVSAGATTLGTLLPWEMGRNYPQIYLFESPTTAETIEFRYHRNPLVLINDTDIPDIPGPHAQILVWDTLLLASSYFVNLPPSAVAMWDRQMQQAQESLYSQHGIEGQGMMAGLSSIRYVPRDYNDEL